MVFKELLLKLDYKRMYSSVLLVGNKSREGADDLVAVGLLVLMRWSLLHHNPVTMLDSFSVLLTYLLPFFVSHHIQVIE